jgi:acyl-coenzyme A synthetase/AMP-(fatty) acid ligase
MTTRWISSEEPDDGPDQGPVSEYPFEPITNLGMTINRNYDLEKTAIIDMSSKPARKFTYNDLDKLSNNVAVFLKSKQISKGDKVAVVSRNCVEFVTILYATYRIGAVIVPLNYKSPMQDLQFMIEDSGAKIVFSDCNFPNSIDIQNLFNLIVDGEIVPEHVDNIEDGLILYTSGSTGTPKGVVIAHKSHLWTINRHKVKDRKWGPKRISIISAPMYHMNGLSTVQGSVAAHSTIIMLPEFNARAYLYLINKYKVNTLFAVTPMIAMLVNEKPLVDETDLSCVRAIFMASAPLSKNLLDNVKHYFPSAWLSNSYGLTEAGPRVFGPHPNKSITKPTLSVGCPVPQIQIRLVDGVLQVKSPSMLTRYNNRPDLMASSLTEDGFFITNDLFSVDENGFYFFVGRADDMFKSGGNTVYPSKIEEILESHSEVQNAVVVAIEDDIKGKKPYAFVIRTQGSVVTEQQLIDHVLANAAVYMHPRRIWFLDTLPLIGSNKIDKKNLEKLAIDYLAVDLDPK